ncbi:MULTISPECIES: DEAD/DEAH box helicase [Vagococcus]|uniref:ATP-dependent RNA helicase YxiN n=1 Tax=Vagococcus fluvialis bH819 TaxID=1255619 RepID=A0A1X6WKD5_9ENTE|nr:MULTISPECIES: DEAD/DEAH box helicase [Vagococcus]SLM84784.1 ATP-dependent RNA helicase YxiN [Vagococcus fluvialis bH819]HCM89756.1 RNA helicase [Vagococcus sp.]
MSTNYFVNYPLDESIIKALDVLKYTKPTQVQQEVIPLLLNKKDVIVKSQTGSGKTAAFGIPICELVEWEERAPQALVLTPTRELATQIKEEIFNIGRYKRIKVEALFGKSSYQSQVKNLNQRTHVVVATPGRLFDHIERGSIDLTKIKTVIIDEADEMFAMGFIEQVEQILKELPNNRTTALFSATMPKGVASLADRYLKKAQTVAIEVSEESKKRIFQQFVRVEEDTKLSTMKDILVVENPESSIIFCNTKIMVDKLTYELQKAGVKIEMLHGGMEQSDRSSVIQDFKRGYFRHLVATDVAARGIDVADIGLVVNYDLPEKAETYVHRIGRTARFENSGKALSLVNYRDKAQFNEILESQDRLIEEAYRPSKAIVDKYRMEFDMKQTQKPTLKKEKGHDFKDDIMKIHINAGKKTKMRPGDVVGALCNIDGMTGDDIGVINLMDISTFVEILNGKGEMVLKTLQTMPIKGRIRRVSRSNESNYEKDLRRNR